jgi:hypothetical protein
MLLVPIKTDAPIYHLPVVTIGMIVVNVVAFAAMFALPEDDYIDVLSDGLDVRSLPALDLGDIQLCPRRNHAPHR